MREIFFNFDFNNNKQLNLNRMKLEVSETIWSFLISCLGYFNSIILQNKIYTFSYNILSTIVFFIMQGLPHKNGCALKFTRDQLSNEVNEWEKFWYSRFMKI